MEKLVILPRGGLGDVLYHALFARYVQKTFREFQPVLVAPKYASFLASLLGVNHISACSLLTDISAGINFREEIQFFRTLHRHRTGCLASFTGDVIDHSLARLFRLSLFDKGTLGNSTFAHSEDSGLVSRTGLNKVLGYHREKAPNPKHIVDRQQQALAEHGLPSGLAEAYREIWLEATATLGQVERDPRLVVVFPETAALKRNLTMDQVQLIVRQLSADYRILVFTRDPARYQALNVEVAGFADRLEPLRQIRKAAAVITADTFSAHLAGISGTPTYVIYNHAPRPVWCEYWGSPFENVFHFEAGRQYQLSRRLLAFEGGCDSPLCLAALQASRCLENINQDSPEPTPVLTGNLSRS